MKIENDDALLRAFIPKARIKGNLTAKRDEDRCSRGDITLQQLQENARRMTFTLKF